MYYINYYKYKESKYMVTIKNKAANLILLSINKIKPYTDIAFV